MKPLTRLLCIAACAMAAACGSHSGDAGESKPVLAVSIEPQRKMLEEIAGDGFQVVTILANGANPESFEPSMAQRKAASGALAYFTIGHMPFEDSFASTLGPGTKVVDSSAGIELITGTHSHGGGDAHAEADPHVWSSIRNGKVIAGNMLAALLELDPDNAEAYRLRHAALEHRLDSIDEVFTRGISAAGAHAFAVWHPSLSYFARDYGLCQIAVGQESKEVSAGKLKEIIDEAREDSVTVFFFQKEYDSRQAESLNSEIGSRLVIINPLAYDWEAELTAVANELVR